MVSSKVEARVLLVDQHPSFRRGIADTLQRAQVAAVVGETDDGEEALYLAERFTPHVVFSEATLRSLSGLELTRRLARAAHPPRTILLSSLNEPAFVRLFLGAGASAYLSKAATREQLLDVFDVVLKGGQCVPRLGATIVADGAPHASPALSPREEQVLRLLACGSSVKDTAQALQVGERTVETYRVRAMEKLTLTSRTDLMRLAILEGWLEPMR